MTLGINAIQHVVSAIMPIVTFIKFFMLSVIMLNIVMLSVVMLNIIMLIVVAPIFCRYQIWRDSENIKLCI